MVVIKLKPVIKSLPKLLKAFGLKGAIKLLLIAPMGALHLAVELGLARFDEDVLDVVLIAGAGEDMDPHGLVRGRPGSAGIPVGEGGVVVSLNRADGKRHLLDDSFKKLFAREVAALGVDL